MNKKFTKLIAAFALLVFMMPSLVGWGQTRTEEVIYTLDGTIIGSGNAYADYHEITQSEVTWQVKGNVTTNPWRIGGKNLSQVDRDLYSENSFSDNITKVVVTNGTATATVNSMTLIVSANSDFSNPTSSVSGSWVASSTTTFQRPANADWTGKYFKLVYNVNCGGSNQYAQFVKAEFYAETGGSSYPVTTINIDASNLTNNDVYVSTDAGQLTATVTYDDNGTPTNVPNASVTWGSSDEDVATIDANGVVTLVAAGTTTITAAYAGVEGEYGPSSATYQLEVTSSAPVVDYAVLPFTYEGGVLDDFNALNGTSYSLNDDGSYAVGNAPYRIKFTKTGDYLQVKTDSQPGNVTVGVKMIGGATTSYIKVQGSADGESFSDIEILTISGSQNDVLTLEFTNAFANTDRYVRLYFTKGSNVGVGPITIAQVSNDPYITASNVELDYNATSGSIMAEIGNYVAGTMTAATEADWITNLTVEQADEVVEVDFTTTENVGASARTATVTLTYTYGDSQTLTKDVTITQNGNPNAHGSVNNPYTVEEAIAATPETGESDFVYVHGIVSEIVDEYNSQYHNISYNISDDGTTTSAQLEAFRGKGMNNANFTSDQDILPGDIVTIYGKLTYYNQTTYELASGNYLVFWERPASTEPSITVTPDEVNVGATPDDEDFIEGTLALTYENLTINDMSDFGIQYYDAEGEEIPTSNEPLWIEVLVAEQDPSVGEGYVVSYTILENDEEARTAYFKVFAFDADSEPVYSNLVTVNQAAPVVPPTPGTWVLTSLADLTADDIFVIVGTYTVDEDSYAMSNDKGTSAAPEAVRVTIVDNTLSEEPAANIQWNVSGNATDGYVFYPNGDNTKWLYITSSNAKCYVGTNESNSFKLDSETGYLRHVATEKYIGIYNTNDWRGYNPLHSNIAGQTFAFYKKVVEPVSETFELPITAEQWYLISSPVGNVAPTAVGNMTEEQTYGLFTFDQTGGDDGKEWRNYKAGAFNQLQAGTGYLYINQGGCTLTFTGTPYTGTGTFPLVYSTSANITESFRGLNLVGNPYAQPATINRDYYIMNGDGTDLTPYTSSIVIPAMQGVFVQATPENQTVTFVKDEAGSVVGGEDKLVVNLSQNRGNTIDRAIVRFGEGSQLAKVQLFENSTKLYIPQNGKDYAIVSTEAQGEMPVNFRASENGTYTLSIDAESMDMNYLHLIDNMTGMDVDLLQTPSYTFEATTRDYESRFRLVFAGNNANADSDNFAFFSNGNLIINNEGNATLQVIDLNGRILSSESVNGSVSTTLNATPGVYMLRLINGENVKVQKIVVR